MLALVHLAEFRVRFGLAASVIALSSVPAAAARTAGSRTVLEFLLAAVARAPPDGSCSRILAFEDPDL